ncbi:MAG: SMC-Scp complex subunit ScpB [Planctomycetota bacterium]|jgi:segregation and condensation protein B
MTKDRQETQDIECDLLDKELAEGLEQTESAEQIEQAEHIEPEELVEEPESTEQEEESAEPIELAEEVEETEPVDQADLTPQDQDVEPTVESVVEAVLFASDEPLSAARLANIVETDTKQVREQIQSLNEKYRANNNAFRIEQIAGGFQMLTLSPYNHWLKKLLRVRSDSKLSAAAMETLAIIAYKQPVMRADIEVIRGVAAGEVIRSLAYKGLVKIVGRAEVLGRPMLYGTTKKFLEVFGLNTLKDLPKVEELKKPPS